MTPFADLAPLVAPRSMVIVGASAREGSQGRRLTENMLLHSRFGGELHLVNPSATEVLGRPCHRSVADIPAAQVDVALVMVSAAHVLDVLEQCAARQVRFAVVMTSGFAETGDAGAALEASLTALAQRTGMRIYGPNCPGFVNLRERLGMTFSPAFKDDLNAGTIGLATQGGGLGRNVLQAFAHGNGVGLWFSAGNECDLGLADFIAFMAADPGTRAIAVLMEGIKDGDRLRAALALARENAKPVVILKVGRSEEGIRAAQSHTASVAGSAAVNSAVFRQYGAIEVQDLDELAAVTRLVAGTRPSPGAGTAIVTFSGGTAAMAADIAGAARLPLAQFTPATSQALRELLPAFASIANPLDTTADVMRDTSLIARSLGLVCADPNVGAVMFPIPTDYADMTRAMAQALADAAKAHDKPIVPVWMSRRLGSGFRLLEEAGLMPFHSLTGAVSALKALMGTAAVTAPAAHTPAPSPGRSALREADGKALLRAAGIAVPEGHVATGIDDAIRIAGDVGYPVAMKISSPDIPHKTEAGGVMLGIANAQQLRAAWDAIFTNVLAYSPQARLDGVLVEKMFAPTGREMLVGVHRDDAFGLVLTVGLGGIFVELLKDVAHRALPIGRNDAHAMLRELRAFAILEGARGQARADIDALEALLVKVSDFAQAHAAQLRELDLNPVWVGDAGQGAVPLDALVVLDATAKAP